MRGAVRSFAVPTAVIHLLLKQMSHDLWHARIEAAKIAEQGQGHAGDARFAVRIRLEKVDAAVAVEPAVQQQIASLLRLDVVWRQPQVAQRQQRVGGRNPLRGVKSTAPRARRVLTRQQLSAPTCQRHLGAIGFPSGRRFVQQIAAGLPTNGRVRRQQPGDGRLVNRCHTASFATPPASAGVHPFYCGLASFGKMRYCSGAPRLLVKAPMRRNNAHTLRLGGCVKPALPGLSR